MNIYQLPNPDEWICKVVHCSDGHRMIKLDVSNPQAVTQMVILFRKVRFFLGLTMWKGANFHIATQTELEDFIKNIAAYRTTNSVATYQSDWEESYLTLFVAHHSEGYTFILANGGSLMNQQGNELIPAPRY
jgi:hypothetical protein